MIKFFRKIRQNLLMENKTSKYFKYAIGEIILVVIGILIALQINNWNQAKKEHSREVNLLEELKLNLQSNVKNLENDIVIQTKGEHYINRLIHYMDHKVSYNDSIPIFLSNGGYAPDVILSSSAFETLKSTGLELIKSNDLRQNIINLFEVSYPLLMQETKRLEDQLWPAVVIPLIQKHCRIIDNQWVPVNYEEMIQDQEFLNMWSFRGALRAASTKIKKQSALKTKHVINLIDKALSIQ